jgi:K+-transporting ATPase c subunit
MIDFSIPLAGMSVVTATVNAAAARLEAHAAAPQTHGQASDVVTLSAGGSDFEASAKAARVQADIAQTLIDIMA